MNRVEIKNFAKEKLSGNLGSIWKILIIALGISLASTCVLSILFNKMDADFLDSLLGILMMPLGIGTTAFFISLIENTNFISETKPTFCTAKFRYRGQDHPVEIEYLDNNEALIKYTGLAKSVTPGQACVLYLGEECLGSGIIKEIYINQDKVWYIS